MEGRGEGTAGDGAGEVVGRRPLRAAREEDYMSKWSATNRVSGRLPSNRLFFQDRRIRFEQHNTLTYDHPEFLRRS